MSIAAFAQWTAPVEPTKPATPEGLDFTASDIEAGQDYYIRNVGSGQFILGGNSWATQISLSSNSVPYMPVTVEEYELGDYTLTPVAGTYTFIGTSNRVGASSVTLNGSSQKLFRDSEESGFVDLGTQNRGFVWNITKVGDYYRIQTSEFDPGVGNWPDYQEQYAGATEPGGAVKFNLTQQDAGIDWEFILAESVDLDAANAVAADYEAEVAAYNAAMEIYNARLALYEMLLDADFYGASTADAGAVYNNADATLAELTAATTALRSLVREAVIAYVNAHPDVDSPVDVSKYLLENADFSAGNISGWTIVKPEGATGNYQYQSATFKSADETSVISGFIESWVPAPNHLSNVTISQKIGGLPNGHYILECDAMAMNQSGNDSEDFIAKEDYTGVYLFYSDGVITLHGSAMASDRDDVYDEENDSWSHTWRPAHFVFEFDLSTTSDSISIGLMADNTNLNWMGADNFKLSYAGKIQSLPSFTALVAEVATSQSYLATEPEAQTAVLTAFSAALAEAETLTAASSDNAKDAEYQAAYTKLNAARMDVVASAAAYAKLNEFIEKLETEAEKYGASTNYETLVDEIEALRDQMLAAADDHNLSADEINSAIDNYDDMVLTIIKQIFVAAVEANEPLEEPLDITVFYNDMEFAFGTSQTAFASGYPAEEPVWMNETGDGNFKTNYSTAEVWNNRPFNIYRDFTDLPKGSYTIQTHAFFRVEANDANYSNWQADPSYGEGYAYLYAGANRSPIVNVAAIACPEFINLDSPVYLDDDNYVPNNQHSAYMIFTDEQYASQAAMCLVEATGNVLADGGTLRVGVAGTDALQANHWTIWHSFRLFYNGAVTDDAMNEQLATLIAQVDETETKGVIEGEQIKEAALEQGNKALDSSSADEKTAAIDALNTALAYMSESATLVDKLMNTVMDYETRMMDLFGAYTDNTLQSLLDEINDTGYEEFESNAQISAWLEQLPASWYAYILSDEGMADATVEEPYDMSALLINATFDNNDYSGWTIVNPETGAAMSGGTAREGVGEFWNSTVYNMYQELPTLKEGYWRLEVDALFRAGGSDAEQAALNVADSIPVNYEYLYASANGINASVQVVQWSDIQRGAIENTEENADLIAMLSGQVEYTSDRYNFVAPNAQSSFVTFVNAERYHNTLDFKYEPANGPIRLGIRMDQTISYNWCPFDNFKLSYLGTEAPDGAILGDANMDGVVDIVDVTTIVDFILMKNQPASEQQFANADVNGDGSIDIADLTSTVSIIQGTYSALVKAERTAVAANDMLIQHGTAFELQNATGYVAFQADVTLASGAELQGVELSRRADDHIVTFRRTGENTYRIIAYSLSNSAFAGGEGELFKLSIAGEQNAEISGAVFTDGYRSYMLTVANEATDIDAITNAASAAQYYDLSGRRVLTPQKGGIYVVNGKTVRVK